MKEEYTLNESLESKVDDIASFNLMRALKRVENNDLPFLMLIIPEIILTFSR